MSDEPAAKIARLTITRLTRTPLDYQKAIARHPDESTDAYAARMQTLADGSAGAIGLIIINEVAQRESPPLGDNPIPHDFTPLSRHVIPIILTRHSL